MSVIWWSNLGAAEVACTRSSWLADERNQMAVAKVKAEKAKLEGEDEGD